MEITLEKYTNNLFSCLFFIQLKYQLHNLGRLQREFFKRNIEFTFITV